MHCTLYGGNNQTLHWLNLKKMNPSSLLDAYDSELLELALLVSQNPALQTVVDRFLKSETSSPEITQESYDRLNRFVDRLRTQAQAAAVPPASPAVVIGSQNQVAVVQQLCVQTKQKQTKSVTVTQNFGGATTQAISQPPSAPIISIRPFPNRGSTDIDVAEPNESLSGPGRLSACKRPRMEPAIEMERPRAATIEKCQRFSQWAVPFLRSKLPETVQITQLMEEFNAAHNLSSEDAAQYSSLFKNQWMSMKTLLAAAESSVDETIGPLPKKRRQVDNRLKRKMILDSDIAEFRGWCLEHLIQFDKKDIPRISQLQICEDWQQAHRTQLDLTPTSFFTNKHVSMDDLRKEALRLLAMSNSTLDYGGHAVGVCAGGHAGMCLLGATASDGPLAFTPESGGEWSRPPQDCECGEGDPVEGSGSGYDMITAVQTVRTPTPALAQIWETTSLMASAENSRDSLGLVESFLLASSFHPIMQSNAVTAAREFEVSDKTEGSSECVAILEEAENLVYKQSVSDASKDPQNGLSRRILSDQITNGLVRCNATSTIVQCQQDSGDSGPKLCVVPRPRIRKPQEKIKKTKGTLDKFLVSTARLNFDGFVNAVKSCARNIYNSPNECHALLYQSWRFQRQAPLLKQGKVKALFLQDNHSRLRTLDEAKKCMKDLTDLVSDALLTIGVPKFADCRETFHTWITRQLLPDLQALNTPRQFLLPLEQLHEDCFGSSKIKFLSSGGINRFSKYHTILDACCYCYNSETFLTCPCGISYCLKCSFAAANTALALKNSFLCDLCRGKEQPSIFPAKKYRICSDCRADLDIEKGEVRFPVMCMHCKKKFCERCTASTRSDCEGIKEKPFACYNCDEKYSEKRMLAAVELITKILGPIMTPGSNSQEWTEGNMSKILWQSSDLVEATNDLSDFFVDIFRVGENEVFEFLLPIVMKIVTAQLHQDVLPMIGAFDMFSCMGLHSVANIHTLQKICLAQAKNAVEKSNFLQDDTSRETFKYNPSDPLRIGFFAWDLLNGPTSDLVWGTLMALNRDEKCHTILFTEGPVNRDCPAAIDLYTTFTAKNCLVQFKKNSTDADKFQAFRKRDLHVLVCLTGWTKGHIAPILAKRVAQLQLHWLGFAGLMYAPFMDYMIVGKALPQVQRQLPQAERCALVSCYQPFQCHPHLRSLRKEHDRAYFNLPPKGFIFCYQAYCSRLPDQAVDIFMEILTRCPGAVLLLIEDCRAKRLNLIKEMRKRFHDASQILFRRSLSKLGYLELLACVDMCLDWPISKSTHTGGGDALGAGTLTLTMDAQENGMQSCVPAELAETLGMRAQLVAVNKQDFLLKAVEFFMNQDKLQLLKCELKRQQNEGIGYFHDSRMTVTMKYIFHTALQSLAHHHGDREKLTDIVLPADVIQEANNTSTDLHDHVTELLTKDSEQKNLRKLLNEMMRSTPPLDVRMRSSALNVMKAFQQDNIQLREIIGSGSSSFVLSAYDTKSRTEIAI